MVDKSAQRTGSVVAPESRLAAAYMVVVVVEMKLPVPSGEIL
jgi:hypothetical protein